MTPIAAAHVSASAEPAKITHLLTFASDANSIVASCVLSPISAMNTVKNTEKNAFNISEQRTVQDQRRNREIDDEPCHIDERGHERRRRRRRIEAEFAQDERQHASRRRAERHHADQT